MKSLRQLAKALAAVPLAALLFTGAAAQPQPAETVTVDNFRLEGMKSLRPELAQKVLDSYRGRPLTFSELERAAQAVSELYREHDFFTVSSYLPKQELQDGSVTIKVVESTINEVKIEGNEHYDTGYINWMLDPIRIEAERADGLPLRSIVQRQLLLLNDNTDLTARSYVRKAEGSDKVDLVIEIEDEHPVHFSFDYNNLGARSSGRNRLGATFEWGNFTNRADTLTLRYVESDLLNADTKGVDLFSLAYRSPLNNVGTNFNFSYANSAFQAGQELQILDIRGDADVFSLIVDHAVLRGPDANLTVNGGFIFQDIENTILGTRLSEDRLREFTFGIQGDWTSGHGRNYGAMQVTQDLGSALGGKSANDPTSSRQAGGGFTKMTFDLGRVQRFNEELYAIVRGHHQAAFAPLPFAEQYGLGGISTVRGYVQSAFLGDAGYNVNAELRWAPLEKHREMLEIGFFLDHGAASVKRPFPGELNHVSVTGAGMGVHLKLPQDYNIRAEVGLPIGRNEITDRDGSGVVPYLIFNKRF